MDIYVNSDVADAIRLYSGLCYPIPAQLTVSAYLHQAAERLYEAHWADNSIAAVLIKNWHPGFVGESTQSIMHAPFAYTDAQTAVAREHGYNSWSAVRKLSKTKKFDTTFEAAVDAVVTGDLRQLRALLTKKPKLVQQTSSFGHKATLLHYVAANGVETYRQQLPLNAAEVAQTLRDAGANPHAEMLVYGGRFTPRALVETSSHPAAAGVTEELLALLS